MTNRKAGKTVDSPDRRALVAFKTYLNGIKMKDEQLKGQATPEQIEAWKKQYGEVVEAKAEGHVAYFKKPTRPQLSYAMSLENQGKTLEMVEHVLKSCYLSGSDVFLKNTDYMLGAAGVVERLVSVKQVEIKNL